MLRTTAMALIFFSLFILNIILKPLRFDKLLKWDFCGLQGALLSHIFPLPIRFSSLSLGPCQFDETYVLKSLSRISDVSYKLCAVQSPTFKFSPKEVGNRCEGKPVVTASSAVVWCEGMEKAEVSQILTLHTQNF